MEIGVKLWISGRIFLKLCLPVEKNLLKWYNRNVELETRGALT